jgi:tRNA1(Val) A37 N6-methylase TrmN6
MNNGIEEIDNVLKLNLDNNITILAENHPSVWFPFSPSCVAMCELINIDNCSGKVVMDLAAGSGVLGIVAAKNGAAQVICTDLNPEAVTASKRNWELNHLNPKQLKSLQSNCFSGIKGNPEFEGKIDRIYLNPPALPDTQDKLQARLESAKETPAGEWNRNGQRGRLVMDSLIVEGKSYLSPGGEILFIATSKNGSRLTARLMQQYWGKGIENSGDDPLDYAINWEERGEANWAVVHRLDIPLKDYHLEFVPLYEQLAEEEGESSPFVKQDGNLYQKLYLIRAQNH